MGYTQDPIQKSPTVTIRAIDEGTPYFSIDLKVVLGKIANKTRYNNNYLGTVIINSIKRREVLKLAKQATLDILKQRSIKNNILNA